MPRTAPLISYINIFQQGAITASSETVDGAALNAVDGNTYDFWVPSSGEQWIEVELDSPALVECVGAAAHLFGTNEATIRFEYWNGAAWVIVASADLTGVGDWTQFAVLNTPITAAKWRLWTSEGSAVGVVHAGPILTFERNMYQGYQPIPFGDNVVTRTNTSETGQILGSSTVRAGMSNKFSFDNTTPEFVRGDLLPFTKYYNDGGAFFWAWHVDKYNLDAAYSWREGKELSPRNNGIKNLMEFDYNVRCYRDGPLPDQVFRDAVVTSTIYPLLFTDGMTAASLVTGGEVKQLAFDVNDNEVLDLNGLLTAGTIRDLNVIAADQLEELDLDGLLTAGTVRNILVVAENQTEADEIDLDGGLTAGTIREVLITAPDQTETDELNLDGGLTGGTIA
jgi:hypothetical protein